MKRIDGLLLVTFGVSIIAGILSMTAVIFMNQAQWNQWERVKTEEARLAFEEATTSPDAYWRFKDLREALAGGVITESQLGKSRSELEDCRREAARDWAMRHFFALRAYYAGKKMCHSWDMRKEKSKFIFFLRQADGTMPVDDIRRVALFSMREKLSIIWPAVARPR